MTIVHIVPRYRLVCNHCPHEGHEMDKGYAGMPLSSVDQWLM